MKPNYESIFAKLSNHSTQINMLSVSFWEKGLIRFSKSVNERVLLGAELMLLGVFAESESVVSWNVFCELLATSESVSEYVCGVIKVLKASKSVKACNIL